MKKLIIFITTSLILLLPLLSPIKVNASYSSLLEILNNESKPYDIGDIVPLSEGNFEVKNIAVFENCSAFNWNGSICSTVGNPVVVYLMEDYDNNVFYRNSTGQLDVQAYCGQTYPNNKYCYYYNTSTEAFTPISYCQSNCPRIVVNYGTIADKIVSTTDLLLKQGSSTGTLDKYGLGSVIYSYNSTFFEENTSYGENTTSYEVEFNTDVYDNWIQLKLKPEDSIEIHEIQTELVNCYIEKSSPQAPQFATVKCDSDKFIHYKKNYTLFSQYQTIALSDETPASYSYTVEFPEEILGNNEELLANYCTYIRSSYNVNIIVNGTNIGSCNTRTARFYENDLTDNIDLSKDEYSNIFNTDNENYIYNWRPNTGIYILDEAIVQFVNLFVPTGEAFNSFLTKYSEMFNQSLSVEDYKILKYIKEGLEAPQIELPTLQTDLLGTNFSIDLSNLSNIMETEVIDGINLKTINFTMLVTILIFNLIPKRNDT